MNVYVPLAGEASTQKTTLAALAFRDTRTAADATKAKLQTGEVRIDQLTACNDAFPSVADQNSKEAAVMFLASSIYRQKCIPQKQTSLSWQCLSTLLSMEAFLRTSVWTDPEGELCDWNSR